MAVQTQALGDIKDDALRCGGNHGSNQERTAALNNKPHSLRIIVYRREKNEPPGAEGKYVSGPFSTIPVVE